MMDGLPPTTDGMEDLSDRMQEYNQTIQEQAFLLGYRNGYREGDLVQDLLRWIREEQAAESIMQERLDALRDVEHFLSSNGAFIREADREITHPPGLNLYFNACDIRPHVQVAGERLAIEDMEFDWDPAPPAPEGRYDGFEPQGEAGEITFQVEFELPEDSEEREELMQFLGRFHGGDG